MGVEQGYFHAKINIVFPTGQLKTGLLADVARLSTVHEVKAFKKQLRKYTLNFREYPEIARDARRFETCGVNDRIIWTLNFLKYQQNIALRHELLRTGTAELMEANPNDQHFGCGLSREQIGVAISQDAYWQPAATANVLGRILMRLREDFRQFGDGPYPAEVLFAGDSQISPVNLSAKLSVVKICWPGATFSRVTSLLLHCLTPAVSHVVCHAGTNDMTRYRRGDPQYFNAKGGTVLKFHSILLAELSEAIAALQNGLPPDVHLLLSEIPPRRDVIPLVRGIQRSGRLNHGLRGQFAPGVTFISHSEFVAEHFNAGGLHLSVRGAEALARKINWFLSNSSGAKVPLLH